MTRYTAIKRPWFRYLGVNFDPMSKEQKYPTILITGLDARNRSCSCPTLECIYMRCNCFVQAVTLLFQLPACILFCRASRTGYQATHAITDNKARHYLSTDWLDHDGKPPHTCPHLHGLPILYLKIPRPQLLLLLSPLDPGLIHNLTNVTIEVR